MTATDEEIFDARFLGRLRALFFKLRKRRQLRKKGAQPTPSAGFTREFKDHRHYTSGDDFRSIDWRLFARLEKVFIRIFEEVQEFHVHILIDRSLSMAEPFGDKRLTALRVAAALTYLALVSQHRVSLLSLGENVRREMPPIKGQGNIHEVLQHLTAMTFAGETDLVGSLKRFQPGRDRRGIVFIITDLLGTSPELAEAALKHATIWPTETHLIHVLAPQEMRPEIEGELQLVDVETQEVRRMWLTRSDLDKYEAAFQAYLNGLEEFCSGRQIDYLRWKTDHSFEEMFLALLMRGSALSGK